MPSQALPSSKIGFKQVDALFDTPGLDGLPELSLPKGKDVDGRQRLDQLLARLKSVKSRCIAFRCRGKSLVVERLAGPPSEHDLMFRFRDASERVADFSTTNFIRALASKSCTADMIDFLLSPGDQGFRMETMLETDRATEVDIRSRILTVREGRLWFEGIETWVGERDTFLRELEPNTYHYLLVPFIKKYWEPGQRQTEESLNYHCFFVVICGLAPEVPRRLVYSDPMMYKPSQDEATGEDHCANFERVHALDPSHHLGIGEIRETVCKTMDGFGDWEDVGAESLPRNILPINSYRDTGSAYAMCMAAAKLMRSPHHYLTSVPPVKDGEELKYNPKDRKCPLRDLYDAEDYAAEDEWEHQAVAKAHLVAMEQLIRAVERGPTAPTIGSIKAYSRKKWEDFVQPASGEDAINDYLYPAMGRDGWKAFLANEQAGRLDLLLYIVCREKLKWDKRSGRFSV